MVIYGAGLLVVCLCCASGGVAVSFGFEDSSLYTHLFVFNLMLTTMCCSLTGIDEQPGKQSLSPARFHMQCGRKGDACYLS